MSGEEYEPSAAELAAARTEWEQRYRSRPQTRAQRDAHTLLTSGQITLAEPDGAMGVDGAWYAAGRGVSRAPVVVVTTMAAVVEVVTGFAGEVGRDAWLADRTHGKRGPLASALEGPPSRAAREEAALAWLLCNEKPGAPLPAGLREQVFTTHSRSEIFLAWRDAGPGGGPAHVIPELNRRLLRAPDWAAASIGSPGERTVPGYLQRIAATPVTQEQAAAALRDLVREDATLVPPRAGHAAAVAARPRQAPDAVPLIPWPRLVVPGQGPAPHP